MAEIYIVAHFHYDAAWLKTREEYLRICHRHMLEALNLLRAFDHYRFLFEQAYLIRTFLEQYPEQKAFFRQCLLEKRLEVTGNYICPDVNLPGGEAFIRQMEMGTRYFREEFGIEVKTGYMVDIFGSHPQIPQLMAQAGFTSYLFGRGMRGATAPSEFTWAGIDGSRILGLWLPLTATNLWPVPSSKPEFDVMVRRVAGELETYAKTGRILLMSGYDYSAPSRDLPVFTCDQDSSVVPLHFTRLDDYAQAVSRDAPKLPVLREDFNPVFQGCYTSRIALKQTNRGLENRLDTCQRLSAMHVMAGGVPGPATTLEPAWEKVVFNQFHDIICGTHTDPVCAEVEQDYRFAGALVESEQDRAVRELAAAIDTRGPGIPVVVINTLAWERTDIVEVEASWSDETVWNLQVVDHAGQPVVHQELTVERFPDGSLKMAKLAFIAQDMPAFGHRVYRIVSFTGERPGQTVIGERRRDDGFPVGRGLHDGLGLVESGFADNGRLSVVFNVKKGIFTSIKNAGGIEILDPKQALGNVITREPDQGDPWLYHEQCEGGETTAFNRVFPFPQPWEADFSHRHQMPGMANADIIPGPVFAEMRSEGRFGNGCRKTVARVYAGISRIDITTSIVNQDEAVRYRAHFPTAIRHGAIHREIPFGATTQPEGEFPCQNWTDYSGKGKGLAVLNRGIPGQGVSDGVFMISLLRSVRGPAGLEGKFDGALEKGIEHTFEYAIVPHAGDWRKHHVPRAGWEYNRPLLACKTDCHKGRRLQQESLLRLSPENVIASLVKTSADGKTITLRVYEAEGKPVKARIQTSRPMASVHETDLLERTRGTLLRAARCSFTFTLRGYGIRTFSVRFF